MTKIIGSIITFIFFIWVLLGCALIYIFDRIGKDIRDIHKKD